MSPPATVEELPFDPKLNPDTYDWSADIAKLTDAVNSTDPDQPVADGRPDLIIDVAAPQFSAALMRLISLNGGYSVPPLHTRNNFAARWCSSSWATRSAAGGQRRTSFWITASRARCLFPGS